MSEKKRILVADDEPRILKFLTGFLSREGFEVVTAADSSEVMAVFEESSPDLILLDIMMPHIDGFEVCRKIREISKVPIIILSAKNETLDKIMGLSLGCDDYLTKPFDSAELLLRIKAVMRRAAARSAHPEADDVIRFPGITINRTSRTVEVADRETELTPKEFELLWLLAGHPKQVFTREQLLYQIWDTEYADDTGIVTTLVKRTREKIEEDPANPRFIKTVRGVGYKFGVTAE